MVQSGSVPASVIPTLAKGARVGQPQCMRIGKGGPARPQLELGENNRRQRVGQPPPDLSMMAEAGALDPAHETFREYESS